MRTESTFEIPCLCGAVVSSHQRESRCPKCGRELAVEWGHATGVAKREEAGEKQSTLFDTKREAF